MIRNVSRTWRYVRLFFMAIRWPRPWQDRAVRGLWCVLVVQSHCSIIFALYWIVRDDVVIFYIGGSVVVVVVVGSSGVVPYCVCFPFSRKGFCRRCFVISRGRLSLFLYSPLIVYFVNSSCCTTSQKYMSCLKESNDTHYKCKDLSRDYLQCRMDHQLMAKEDLNHVSVTVDLQIIPGNIH